MTDQEKLLEKIQKILNLGSSSNANEAAAALEKAAALMAAHNLSHRDLARAQIGEAFVRSTQAVSKMKDWEGDLMVSVGKAFGCKCLWQKGNSKNKDYWGRFIFIGTKDQVALCEYTATVLLRKLVKERAAFSMKLSYQGFNRGPEFTAQLDGFCKGWIKIVKTKIVAFANSRELQDIIDEHHNQWTKGRVAKAHDRGTHDYGYRVGVIAAKEVDIHRPMNEDDRKKLGSS